jgi:hypothetical protein
VICTVVDVDTGDVVIHVAPDTSPAGTVTVLGTVTELLAELRATADPPVGAGQEIVTITRAVAPPVTDTGLMLSLFKLGARIPNSPYLELPGIFAVISVTTLFETGWVATINGASCSPARMVTELWGTAEAELELNATDKPPAGALALTVTVP